jgi:hypothetical protein
LSIETVSQLKDEILARCQDSSFTFARILRYLNDCQKHVSSLVQLPNLEATGTVTTSSSVNYVSMPTDYQRKLYKCNSSTNNRWIKVYESKAAMDRFFSDTDLSGSIVAVTVQGSQLHYQRRSSEELTLYYLKKPTDLTGENSQTECIPEPFVRGLMVNFALKEIFSIKSVRTPEAKEFHDLYSTNFNEEMDRLREYLGPERQAPIEVPDEMGLSCFYD